MANNKEIFQLAESKGYKLFHNPAFLWTKRGEEYLIRDIEPLLELTLIQKWLRDTFQINVAIVEYNKDGSLWIYVQERGWNKYEKLSGYDLSEYYEALSEGITVGLNQIQNNNNPS